MLKKAFLTGVLLVFIFSIYGCTIAKGTCGLVGGAAVGATEGVKQGAKEDRDWITKSIQYSDEWVKRNLW